MEKTVNLILPGVKELDQEEMQQIQGGWTRIFYAYLIMLAKEAVTEGLEKCFEDFKEGYEEGYNN